MHLAKVSLALSLVSLVAAGGCKKEGSNAKPAPLPELVARPPAVDVDKLSVPALFASIPADSPYVFAAFEAIPLDYYAKVKRAIGPALDSALYRIRAAADDESFDELVTSVIEEFDGKWNAQGFEQLGFTATPRFALYGLGVAPVVFRIEVKDDKAVLATIERIATRAQLTLPAPQTKDNRAYWRIPTDNGDATGVVALADNQLVIAFGRTTDVDQHLGLILGSEKPAQNMADGKTLSGVMSRHGFGPHMIGFADSKLLATQALTLAGLPASPACSAEIDRVSARVPRVVLGYSRLTTGVSSGGFVLELAPDLIKELEALKIEVPGLNEAVSDQPMMAFGGGIDLDGARKLALAAAKAVQGVGVACNLAELAEEAGEAVDAMSNPLPAPVALFTGAVIALQEMSFGRGGMGMPEKLEGAGSVTSTDAKQLFDAILGLAPMIGQFGIKADGQLHAVTGLPIPMKLYGGVGDRAIAFGVGDRGKQLAGKLMGARSQGKSPFMLMTYDYGKFLELQSQMSRMFGDDPDLLVEAEADLNAGLAKLFGRAAGSLDVNDKGLVFWASIEMK